LLGPGATGIVGAAGGAMHAAKDMVAANAAAICQEDAIGGPDQV
jgi:hypothetical protein